MTHDEINALTALCAAHGRPVYDPRYATHPAVEEAKLRESVRRVWKAHGKNLPEWVREYTKRWAREIPKTGSHQDDGH